MEAAMTIPEFCAYLRKQSPEICEVLDRVQRELDNAPIPYEVTGAGKAALGVRE